MTDTAAILLLPKAAAWARGAIRRDRANAYALLEPWTLPPLGGNLPRLGLMPPDYEDAAWSIRGGVVTEMPFALDPANCDGCTLAPDFLPRSFGGLRAYVAAIFHDRWYAWIERFAAAWGWARARVRRLGDIIFHSILRSLARRLRGLRRALATALCRVYYRGVRAFGGVAHDMMKKSSPGGGDSGLSGPSGAEDLSLRREAALSLNRAIIALAGLLLSLGAGCSGGCSPIPLAWDDNVGLYRLEEPAVAFTNTVTGAHFVTQSRGEGGDAENLGDSASSASPRETEPEEAE